MHFEIAGQYEQNYDAKHQYPPGDHHGFIDIENRINSEINADKTVIATGGSVVYGKEAMEHYKEIGTVVYLKVSFETLKKRLHHAKQRGVVMKDGQTLESLYEERKALYEQYSDITVDEERDSLEKVIEKVSGYFSDN